MSETVIIAAANKPAEKNKAGHSQLYEWYWARYDLLLPHLMPPRTPNWSQVAQRFSELAQGGEAVRDGLGRVPNSTVCRQTWRKVVRDKQRVASGLAAIRQRQSSQPASPASLVEPAADVFEEIVLRAADGSVYDPNRPRR